MKWAGRRAGGKWWRARLRRRRRLGETDRWLDGDPGSIDLGISITSSGGRAGRLRQQSSLLPLRNSPNGLPSQRADAGSPKAPQVALTAAKVFLTGVGSPKIVPLPSLLSIWMNLALDMTDVDGTSYTVQLAKLGGHLMRTRVGWLAAPSKGSPDDAGKSLDGWVVLYLVRPVPFGGAAPKEKTKHEMVRINPS